jgi:hypothetical protein
MSIKIQFATLSIGASVDQQTGNLSVFDILEEVRTPQLPVQLPFLVIALIIEKKEATDFSGKMLIHLFTPDGAQQMIGSGDMRVPAEQKRMKAVFRLGGFPVSHYGNYRFVLSFLNSAGTKIGEAILGFDSIQVPQVAQGVAPEEKPKLAH